MSKLIEDLARKIQSDTGLEMDPSTFVSFRPKPAHKCAGAWSWKMDTIHFGKTATNVWTVGSIWTASECCRKGIKLMPAWDDRHEVELVPEEIIPGGDPT